ncbi:hypothetical protein BH09BAC1_BH09BAC1_01760 [soil metagenome]
MKLPRNLSGLDLIKALKKYEYEIVRQKGSHIRLRTTLNGEHNITIPNHNPLKSGTLSAILSAIAEHQEITKEALIEALFEK